MSVQVIRRDHGERDFALVIESPRPVDDGLRRVSDVAVRVLEAARYVVRKREAEGVLVESRWHSHFVA